MVPDSVTVSVTNTPAEVVGVLKSAAPNAAGGNAKYPPVEKLSFVPEVAPPRHKNHIIVIS